MIFSCLERVQLCIYAMEIVWIIILIFDVLWLSLLFSFILLSYLVTSTQNDMSSKSWTNNSVLCCFSLILCILSTPFPSLTSSIWKVIHSFISVQSFHSSMKLSKLHRHYRHILVMLGQRNATQHTYKR